MLEDITVLFIDDDLDTQIYVKALLEDDIKELYLANNGIEGFEIYKEKKPDVILTDINMPELDGLSMIKKIRNADKSQPILILSAFDHKENLLEAINLGSNGFIKKPIDIDLLYDRLKCIAKKIQDKKKTDLLNKTKIDNLYRLAHFDNLTNIPNKYLFEITLNQVISKAKRHGGEVALFFIDLDNFKEINDNYGHKIGDAVLKSVANSIKKVIRDEDVLARRSGDEFLLLVENVKNKNSLEALSNKIIKIVSNIGKNQDIDISLTLSIGISLFPKDSKNAEELIYFADIAMYEAKNRGKNNFVFYDSQIRKSCSIFDADQNDITKATNNNI